MRLREAALSRIAGFGLDANLPSDSGPVACAREIAVLNPYVRRQRSFLLRPPRGALARFVAVAQTLPREAAARFDPPYALPKDALPLSYATPRDLVSAFQSIGLTAEWAEGFALFNPVADLPLLAQSAERWRRMVAGDWPYGAQRPSQWATPTGPDRLTTARATALLAAPDPDSAARRDLLFWSQPTHETGPAMRHLHRRFAARYAACLAALPTNAATDLRLSRALARFHKDRITSLCAAPLAVLAARGRSTDHAFFPPE